jgi:hypothetical protein
MANDSRATNTLLLIILLAVLLEPLAIAFLLRRETASPVPGPDRELADAIRQLSRELDRPGIESPRVAPSPTPGTPEAPSESQRAREPSAPFPQPESGVRTIPAAARRYQRKQERVDAWVDHVREAKERGEEDQPNLFFHRTADEILGELGVPDEATDQSAGVRWCYRSSGDRGSLLIDFHRGRVYRFWFGR